MTPNPTHTYLGALQVEEIVDPEGSAATRRRLQDAEFHAELTADVNDVAALMSDCDSRGLTGDDPELEEALKSAFRALRLARRHGFTDLVDRIKDIVQNPTEPETPTS